MNIKTLLRGPFVWVAVVLLLAYLGAQMLSGDAPAEIDTSEGLELLRGDTVEQVEVNDTTQRVELVLSEDFEDVGDLVAFYYAVPQGETVMEAISAADPEQGYNTEVPQPSVWASVLGFLLPMLIILAIFWFLLSRMQGGGGMMKFGKSKAKLVSKETPQVTFADVAGADEAVEELQEIREFLADSEKFQQVGAKIPKGVLLYGPPGTGKTLLARAVAGEAGVPFYSISGSDFVEMFVGVGASRVRDLFQQAKSNAPAITAGDEIDAVGRHRGAGMGGGHDEREQTLNQLLVEMDGFDINTNLIPIAATNRPDTLDPALLRPGRFDRQITVGLPTMTERRDILKVHVRNKPVAEDVDLERLAGATPMFSGADLENLTNEAALIAARSSKQVITWTDFNEALDRITLGLRRSSLTPTEEERRVLAFHEAGHAVAFAAQPDLGSIRKVTIMPRGGAGGFMAPLAKEELLYNIDRFRQQLIVAFGGRVAEKKLTGTISSGASNDLKQATDLAKKMVFDLGMGEHEYISWGSDDQPVFLGGEISRRKDFSEETARQLEEQVHEILSTAYARTHDLIDEHWTVVEGIAGALLKRETIDGQLIHEAFDKASDGMDAEELADWIEAESIRREPVVTTGPDVDPRPRKDAAAEERRREAGERPGAPLDPRPTPGAD